MAISSMAKKVAPDAPKIEFPCDYPIRVLGDASEQFIDQVFSIMQQHAPEISRDKVKTRPSRKGTFVSVHIIIRATGEQQLSAIHRDLQRHPAVKMVI